MKSLIESHCIQSWLQWANHETVGSNQPPARTLELGQVCVYFEA